MKEQRFLKEEEASQEIGDLAFFINASLGVGGICLRKDTRGICTDPSC